MVPPIVAARPSLCPVVLPGTYEPRATTETVLASSNVISGFPVVPSRVSDLIDPP